VAVSDFFDGIMGQASSHSYSIDFHHLDLPHLDLDHLTDRFTEAEVWAAISSMPLDKAPGTDGFSARFYQAAWSIIRLDIMWALDMF
jgi:hypothetical protein